MHKMVTKPDRLCISHKQLPISNKWHSYTLTELLQTTPTITRSCAIYQELWYGFNKPATTEQMTLQWLFIEQGNQTTTTMLVTIMLDNIHDSNIDSQTLVNQQLYDYTTDPCIDKWSTSIRSWLKRCITGLESWHIIVVV